MSTAQTLILGAVAGFTIFLGLPIARMRSVSPAVKTLLASSATGILIFLLWDVLSHGVGPVEEAIEEHAWSRAVELVPLLAGGFIAGLMGLVYYDAWMKRRRQKALLGPGAASEAEFARRARSLAHLSPARALAVFIATGIGLHNFGEGLAIGQAAASDEVSLALVLIIGFALHNATEGFGICAPLQGEADAPGWGFLALLGVIGGLPTFLGTALGQAWVSEAVSVAFFALAAGSILYVVIELLNVVRGAGAKTMVTWGIILGLTLGFGTDFFLEAVGG
jgi:zinc transporter, ZIP family